MPGMGDVLRGPTAKLLAASTGARVRRLGGGRNFEVGPYPGSACLRTEKIAKLQWMEIACKRRVSAGFRWGFAWLCMGPKAQSLPEEGGFVGCRANGLANKNRTKSHPLARL